MAGGFYGPIYRGKVFLPCLAGRTRQDSARISGNSCLLNIVAPEMPRTPGASQAPEFLPCSPIRHITPFTLKMSTTGFPLTSTFTPPATCLSTLYYYDSPTGFWVELGPSNAPDCLPPNYQSSLGIYYSPGVCPSGYTEACSSSVLVDSLTETRATCCPRQFICLYLYRDK